jgi:hypothetical protein
MGTASQNPPPRQQASPPRRRTGYRRLKLTGYAASSPNSSPSGTISGRRLDAEAEERRKLTAMLTDQRPPFGNRYGSVSGLAPCRGDATGTRRVRTATSGRLDQNPVFCPWMRFGGFRVPNTPRPPQAYPRPLKSKSGVVSGQGPMLAGTGWNGNEAASLLVQATRTGQLSG